MLPEASLAVMVSVCGVQVDALPVPPMAKPARAGAEPEQAGELVVTDGQMQLADGVSVQERPAVPVPAAQGAAPPQPASQAKP